MRVNLFVIHFVSVSSFYSVICTENRHYTIVEAESQPCCFANHLFESWKSCLLLWCCVPSLMLVFCRRRLSPYDYHGYLIRWSHSLQSWNRSMPRLSSSSLFSKTAKYSLGVKSHMNMFKLLHGMVLSIYRRRSLRTKVCKCSYAIAFRFVGIRRSGFRYLTWLMDCPELWASSLKHIH